MKQLKAVAIYEVADDDNVSHEIECLKTHLDNAVEIANVNVKTIEVSVTERAHALKRLRELADSGDAEAAHVEADLIILALLDDNEVAQAFMKVPRWYA